MRKIVLSVLCLLVSVFTLAGCSNNSEPFEEKTYTPDTQISEINLDVRDREIEVVLSEDGQVHIQYSENSKEYYAISISDENVLTMTNASKSGRIISAENHLPKIGKLSCRYLTHL